MREIFVRDVGRWRPAETITQLYERELERRLKRRLIEQLAYSRGGALPLRPSSLTTPHDDRWKARVVDWEAPRRGRMLCRKSLDQDVDVRRANDSGHAQLVKDL